MRVLSRGFCVFVVFVQALLCISAAAQGSSIAFVQVNSAVPQTPQSTVSVPYASAQTAGNLNVVVVGWNDSTAAVQSIADTSGNTYILAVGPTIQSGTATQSIYYAKNIVAAAANGNTVTATFTTAAAFPDIRIAEYSGLDTVNPFDGSFASQGNNWGADSGPVTITASNDLLVGANLVQTATSQAGTGFTSRVITDPNGDVLEDQVVTATGSYDATSPLTGPGPWVMQIVAFRAASTNGFVQSNSATPQTPQTTVTATYLATQSAGNLNVVVVGWNDSTSAVQSVSDTAGNTYALVVGPTVQTGTATQSIYYAKNIAHSAANANAVIVTFTAAARFPDIRIAEYSGLDPVNPLDTSAGAQGNSASADSGSAATSSTKELLIGASLVQSMTTAAGTGFTNRIITAADSDILEDGIVTAAASYNATAALDKSQQWIMQLVAFRMPPAITTLSPASGPVGVSVTISGTNFGATQGSSTVAFHGVSATPSSWSETSIVVPVPSGATTGSVVVTVGGVASNGVQFTVAPSISSLSPTSGPVGTSVSVTGSNFGPTQGPSTVTFNGALSTPSTWTDTQIIAPVPIGATTGNVVVTVATLASNAVTFTVTSGTPPSISASVSPSPNAGGWNNSNVTVTFTCTAGSAAIANCPAPQSISSEGANQIVSGTATDANGLTATTSVTLNIDKTQPAAVVTSPADGTGFSTSAVTISGSASDSLSGVSSVTCDGVAANVGGGNFSCNISLNVGVNLVVVRVTDLAGNVSGSNFHLTLNGAFPSPNSLQITPSGVNMVVGQTQQFTAADELGRPRTETTWTVSDTTLASITPDSSPTLTALAVGQVTLTATVQSVTAQIQINILSGTSLPAGTVIWSAPSVPGFGSGGIIQAVPTGGNTPDLYAVDTDSNGNNLIRGFSADGLQIMQTTAGPGGVSPDGFGGLLLTSGSGLYPFITVTTSDRDGVTGSQVWSYSTLAQVSTPAIRQDGTIFSIETTPPDATHFNSDSSSLVAVDGTVGAPLLRLPLPSSTFKSIDCNGVVFRDFEEGPFRVSNLAIDSDGTVLIAMEVETSVTNFSCDGNVSSEPFNSTLYLFQLKPDGSNSLTPIHSYTTDLSTQTGRTPVAEPWKVIPDGQGGFLVGWAGITNNQPLLYITYISTSGLSDYPFPSLEPIINSIVLGDNATAYVCDGQTIQAFNVSTGQSLWSYTSQALDGIAIIASTSGGGLVTKEFPAFRTEKVVRFDATGAATSDPWTTYGVQYFLGHMWLGTPVSSSTSSAIYAAPNLWPLSVWAQADQRRTYAATPPITVHVARVNNVDLENQLSDAEVSSRVEQAATFWQTTSNIILKWDGTLPIARTPGCDPAQPLCSTGNLYDITEVASNVTALGELSRRFKQPKGLQLVYCYSVAGSTAFGITVAIHDSLGNIIDYNISALGKDANQLATAHEIGHIFQLLDTSNRSNFMCSGVICPQHPSTGITDDQIRDARRFAPTLASGVKQ